MLKNQKAFTLVELLVSLSVLGVLVAMAVPSFKNQIIKNQSSALAEDALTAVNFTRIEAIKRGKPVTFCPSNSTGDGCGDDWANGWLVVVDTAATEVTKPPVVANETDILRRWSKNIINAKMIFSESREFIRFNGLGYLARVEGANKAVITTSIKDCTGKDARAITVAPSGMITNQSADCAAAP